VPATLSQLLAVRSTVVEEVLAYLWWFAVRMAELPKYYPADLRTGDTSRTLFDDIRQTVKVVEDRSAFERWFSEERERMRAAGQEFDRVAYTPNRARPEFEADGHDPMPRDRPSPPKVIRWDEHAGERFKRAIILGDPGFGKTWLLRYEARRLAREYAEKLYDRVIGLDDCIIPIFARLSDINRRDDAIEYDLVSITRKTLANGLENIAKIRESKDAVFSRVAEVFPRSTHRQPSPAFSNLVREKLMTGQCAILLDALDEVPAAVPEPGEQPVIKPHTRQRLRERLEEFAVGFSRPRLLITSRIIGYTTLSISDLKELELLAFERPEVESFARVWFGDDQETGNQFLAKQRESHQVRGLARIPLLLALICRVYSERKEKDQPFPARRVELYDLCLRGLLWDWKEEKDRGPTDDGEVSAMLEMLKSVSYSLFEEGYEQFTVSVIEAKISSWLDGLKPSHRFQGRKARALVDELKLDGILVTAGEHREAPMLFLHRTFQEYLAASALKERAESEGWDRISGLVDKRAWLDEWSEVITLLAGQMADPVPLLELLRDKRRDDYFRHRLCLASRCLPELPPEPASRSVTQISAQIADEVLMLWWEQNESSVSFSHVSRCLPNIARARSASAFLEIFELLGDSDERLYKGGPLIYTSFFGFGPSKGDRKKSAAYALGLMGEAAATPEVLRFLLAAFSDQDRSVRCSAANALGRMGAAAATPEVLRSLLAALGGLEDMRLSAAKALGQMGEGAATPEVLQSLLAALGDHEGFRGEIAAEALGRMGKAAATPEVLQSLLAALGDHARRRSTAAEALGRMGKAAATPEVLQSLLGALGDQNRDVRRSAAEALGLMGEAAVTPEVLQFLLAALGDQNDSVRRSAAEGFGLMGEAAASPEVFLFLLSALGDQNGWVRSTAAEALGRMGKAAATPEVLQSLLGALGDRNRDVCGRAAEALGLMGEAAASPEVFQSLLAVLDSRQRESGVCSTAARALGQMGDTAATPEVLRFLLAVLGNPNRDGRAGVAEALSRMMAHGIRVFQSKHGALQRRNVSELSR
jgi:HEAT repeat protein